MGDLLPESLAEMFDKMQKEGKEDSAKTKSCPIDTPLEWGLAFSTFVAVATHYNSERGPQLITYANIIFRLAKEVRGKVWLRYDGAFREAAAVQPSLRWDHREPDIWLASIAEDQNVQPTVSPAEATTSPGNDSIASRRKPSLDRRSTVHENVCHRWNRFECQGDSCCYAHNCLVCAAPGHPAKSCPILFPAKRRGQADSRSREAYRKDNLP